MSIRTRSSLLALALLVAPLASIAQTTEDDPALATYRERFRAGYSRYKAGDVAQAIQYWEPLYGDLGPTAGYRLAYDLARAYETFGDATRAAERYEVFVREAAQRQDLPPEVVARQQDAKERLEALKATRGRIFIPATTPPSSVAIDATEPRLAGFLAYVAPGPHTVVFDPGSNDMQKKDVTVEAGAVVELLPDTKPPEPRQQPPPPRVVQLRSETEHPLSGWWLVVAGTATAASFILPYLAYSDPSAIYTANSPCQSPCAVKDRYSSERTLYYASWAAPALLGAATIALTTWYFAGQKTKLVPIAGPKDAGLMLHTTF